MRRPRHLNFECSTCGTTHTRLVETNDDDTPLAENDDGPIAPETCGRQLEAFDLGTVGGKPDHVSIGVTTCVSVLVHREAIGIGYMKTIVKGSHDFNERERERLEKRADDHWKREGRHEAIEVERAVLKRNGMEGAGGVR